MTKIKLDNKNSKKENLNELPLFNYLPESGYHNNQDSYKFKSSNIFGQLTDISKYYITNFCLFFGVLLSILFMFYVQFKTDNLQNNIVAIDKEITAYKNEIRILEAEWVYLTRPERLRILSARYLKNNRYSDSNQIKDIALLKTYYQANLKRLRSKKLAMKIKN